VESPISCR